MKIKRKFLNSLIFHKKYYHSESNIKIKCIRVNKEKHAPRNYDKKEWMLRVKNPSTSNEFVQRFNENSVPYGNDDIANTLIKKLKKSLHEKGKTFSILHLKNESKSLNKKYDEKSKKIYLPLMHHLLTQKQYR